MTVADSTGFDVGEKVYKVYEGTRGTRNDHRRLRNLGYI